MVNVTMYSSTMDPMGMVLHVRHFELRHVFFGKQRGHRPIGSGRPVTFFVEGRIKTFNSKHGFGTLDVNPEMGMDADDDDVGMVVVLRH